MGPKEILRLAQIETPEAAMRLARAIASDISLYNEQKVTEGRKSRDLYTRLKDDIDRSKQMYAQRVNPKIDDALRAVAPDIGVA